MVEPDDRSPLTGAGRLTVPERAGLQAKCSFLLRILADDDSEPSERAMALLGLLDDLDHVVDALSPDDLAQLRALLDDVLRDREHRAPWSVTALPDESASPADAIDGINVRRVVVPSAEVLTVVNARLSRRDPIDVSVEYSFDGDAEAVLEVVTSASAEVIASTPLGRGVCRLASILVPADEIAGESDITIRIANRAAAEPVHFYKATFTSVPEAADAPVRQSLQMRVREREADPASAFNPITSEPLTLHDIDRLTGLRDTFRGERIFIMGNGPSLNRTPLHLLENDYVFGVNRISLLFDRVSWRPTFFTAFDVRVVPDNKEEFAELDVPYKFFSARYKTMLGERDNHFWYHTKGNYEGFDQCFEPTVPYSGFGGGGTIGVMAIELAFYMGFREIYLIGTDVSYSVPATVKQAGPDQFGDGVKLELTSTRDDDPNHFDPRYFGKDKSWHNPNVREMKIGFARAAAYIERRGGALRNATVGGELDEVPRVSFESLF